MIPRTLSRQAVRDVDRRAISEFGLPGVVLMENAGRGCVDWLCELGISGRVVVCAGKGNNGGDGFVIARHLTNRGFDVRVLLFCEPQELRGDAAINFNVIVAARASIRVFGGAPSLDELADEFAPAKWIVDALLGTGTQGLLREPYVSVIKAINQRDRPTQRVLAIDLPSGLDCDLGEPIDSLCVEADATATFVARKVGFDNPAALRFIGDVRVIDIGVPHSLFD